jgi:hypothetical protein
MLYTSLLVGYSRRFIRREDAIALLARAVESARRRYGSNSAISLGCIGPGILGNEHCYSNIRELQEDVAIVQKAGVNDITVYDLGGALLRRPLEPWLDALAHTECASVLPGRSGRSLALTTGAMLTSWPLYWLRRWRTI